jgi:hypothetical protein
MTNPKIIPEISFKLKTKQKQNFLNKQKQKR